MTDSILEHHEFPILGRGYFLGGRASTAIKRVLADAGVEADVIERAAVACYEAEMNVVLHARSGVIELNIYEDRIYICLTDQGPGINDISLAMTRGWSTASAEARGLGFGAGMGLSNIKDHVDEMTLESEPGKGVCLAFIIYRGGGRHEQ